MTLAAPVGCPEQGVRHGIQNIRHASFADEGALDMLKVAKKRHCIAPELAWLIGTAGQSADSGVKPGSPLALSYERAPRLAIDTQDVCSPATLWT